MEHDRLETSSDVPPAPLSEGSRLRRDRRRHDRKKVAIPCELDIAGLAERVVGHIPEMSVSGCFVATSEAQPFGTAVTVHFTLDGTAVVVGAIVRWSSSRGLGLQFQRIGVSEVYAVSQHLADKPPATVPPPPEASDSAREQASKRWAELRLRDRSYAAAEQRLLSSTRSARKPPPIPAPKPLPRTDPPAPPAAVTPPTVPNDDDDDLLESEWDRPTLPGYAAATVAKHEANDAASSDAVVTALQSRIAQLELLRGEHEARIAALTEQLAQRDEQLAQRDDELARRDDELAQRDEQLAATQQLLETRVEQVQSLRDSLKEQSIEHRAETLAMEQQHASAMLERLAQLQERSRALLDELDVVTQTAAESVTHGAAAEPAKRTTTERPRAPHIPTQRPQPQPAAVAPVSDAGVDEPPARMTIPYDLSERDSEAPADGDEPARDSICDEPTTESPAAAAQSDDLTRIRGIGPGYARKLAAAGVTRFAQIASWSESEVEAIAATLGISPRRIRNADWMGSAAELLND